MTVRTLLAVANAKGYLVEQLDEKNAFLHGKISEDIFMEPPDGSNIPAPRVYKQVKSLYG